MRQRGKDRVTQEAERDVKATQTPGQWGIRFRHSAMRAYIRLLRSTARVQRVGDAMLDRLHRGGHTVILTCWQNDWLAALWLLEGRGISAFAGPTRQDDLCVSLLSRLGWNMIRGNYPSRAILEMKQQLESGHDVALALDGPRGPYRQAQPGAFFLAEKSGHPIVPFAIAARPMMASKMAEGMALPVPFGRVSLYFGAPVWVDRGSDAEAFRRKKEELERSLNEAGAGAKMALEW